MFNEIQLKYIKNNVFSSYNKKEIKESYGNFFYGLVTMLNPKQIVEIGTCKGYSSVFMAKGLKDCQSEGQLHCFDLWEEDIKKTNFHKRQIGKHLTSNKNEFQKSLEILGLENNVKIHTSEAFKVLSKYENNTVDLIHVDIGNCGDSFDRIIKDVHKVLKVEGLLLFEGGTKSRDCVSWMKEYDKKSIYDSIENSDIVKENFEKLTISIYPSITLLKKVK